MRHLNHLPIWRDTNRLMLEVEQAIRVFPRYHKYTIGAELRASVLRLRQTIHRAWSRTLTGAPPTFRDGAYRFAHWTPFAAICSSSAVRIFMSASKDSTRAT